ncbi:MAG TPA: type VI secretion system membrane subunit TssM, partial [Pseudomonadales bacterium]|nr:type VI secretion system membrane subunit TssM [Pseudomonadales bacterium]
MKKILGLIFNRWVLTILGLIAVSLLIWFVGPLIAIGHFRPLESALIRWIAIAAIVIFYLGKMIWDVVRIKLANAKLMEGLSKPSAQTLQEGAGTEEVAVLSKRFADAADVLKSAKLGSGKGSGLFGGKRYVYELPWYIFIGAPGSGKTTALINSGLQFPLAEKFGQESIRGIGGTRNCDWWFTNEAVLIDTAGRYTTQESNQAVDSAAWKGFLELLKKYRPRRPINGVLLTISMADLLQQTASQREMQAAALRHRIQELHEELNIRYPIYVLVTKSDLLAGFSEYFGEYGKDERAQVWGVTFPYSENPEAEDPLKNFPAEFSILEKRINDRLIDRLQQERDPQKRALLYSFPQQFSAIKDVLNDFLGQVFSPSRYQFKPLLRGVYFTSGTQEGNPIDRVMGGLARSLKLERRLIQPLKASGKSFFLNKVVKEVIFPEAGIAGTNLKWERQRALVQWGSIAAACAITIGLTAIWGVSFTRNRAYVDEVETKIKSVSEQVEKLKAQNNGGDLVGLLPVLASVQTISDTVAVNRNDAPVSMGFGLYQGDKLQAAADNAYRRLLQDAFLPRLAISIEQLLQYSVNQPDLLYESLKAYIMMGDPTHLDPEALKSFISAYWEESLPREVTAEQRTQLHKHLDTLLENGQLNGSLILNKQLIDISRAAIAQTPIERRIYNRIRRQGVGSQFPEFTIADVVGPNAGIVFRRASGQSLTSGVPGLFSYKGYYDAFVGVADKTTQQLADEEGWVLGLDEAHRGRFANAEAKEQLFTQVRQLYLQDYADPWDHFIKDIRVNSSSDTRQTIQTASILSGPTSPLPVLLRAIVKEVTLVKKDEADKNIVEKGSDQLRQRTEELKKFFGTEKPKSNLDVATRPEVIVDNRFDELRRLVTSPVAGQPAPIDAQMALLKELTQAMVTANSAVEANLPPPPSDAPNKAKLEASQSPEPVKNLLQSMGDSAAQLIGLGAKTNASGELGQLAEFCRKAVSGRYPFSRSSALDVTPDD